MNKEQIVGLAVRLFAVFLLVYTVRYLNSYIPLLNGESYYKGNITPLIIFMILPILISIFLWFFPVKVATQIIPKVSSSESETKFTANEVESVAFSILGIWVLARAVPDILYWLTVVFMIKNTNIPLGYLKPEYVGGIVATIIEIIIGIWFLFGSKGIIHFVRKIRYAGNKNTF